MTYQQIPSNIPVPRSPEGLFTVAIGGAAGDGVREAGIFTSHFLDRLCFYVYSAFYYPSLIRGGHNLTRISFSMDKVRSDHRALDLLFATNLETVEFHLHELKEGAIVLVDEAFGEDAKKLYPGVIALPMQRFAKEMNTSRAGGLGVALGVFAYMLGLDEGESHALVEKALSYHRYGTTLELADRGFRFAKESALPQWKNLRGTCAIEEREVVGGNKGAAMGLVAAGLETFFGYPMTPSTSVLTYLARERTKLGLTLVSPEDEIAVMNMAIGATFAGKRAALTTGTGGFALMQEGFSLAGISESPIVAVVSQRAGPATGVPTHTAQADLQFVIHSGHGEFPRFVFAPGDSEESFVFAAHAMNLAWKFQTPAILLLDKTISENLETGVFQIPDLAVEKGKRWDGNGTYQRYASTDDGISPYAPAGTPGAVVKATSYEHDEYGVATEDPDVVRLMQEKRFRKAGGMLRAISELETIKSFGDETSDTVILCFGSTKGAAIEALRYISRPTRVVQVIGMEPFDSLRFIRAIGDAKRIIAVEGNHNAQLAALVREKTGIIATHTVTHYDSTPFSSHMIAERINQLPE